MPFLRHIARCMENKPQEIDLSSVARILGPLQARFSMCCVVRMSCSLTSPVSPTPKRRLELRVHQQRLKGGALSVRLQTTVRHRIARVSAVVASDDKPAFSSAMLVRLKYERAVRVARLDRVPRKNPGSFLLQYLDITRVEQSVESTVATANLSKPPKSSFSSPISRPHSHLQKVELASAFGAFLK